MGRLLALCAVLLGLFLMHGDPAGAAGGCHGAMSSAVPMDEGHASARAPVPAPMSASMPAPTARHAGEQAGTTCVSTPARERTVLPPGALAAGLAAVFPPGRRPALGRRKWRGPPPAGRGLLLRMCIART